MSPSKQQKLVEDLVPYVVVVSTNSDGSYPSDLTDLSDTEEHLSTPPPLETTHLEDNLLNIPSLREVKLEYTHDHNSSVTDTIASHDDAAVECSLQAGAGGVAESRGMNAEEECMVAQGGNIFEVARGIFKNAKAAVSDMEWTSDESDCIGPMESLERLAPRVHSTDQDFLSPPKVSPSPRSCRRKWTEEEHACLLEGVRLLGEGKWKEIKNMYRDVLKDRAAVHLKDRYRNTEGKRGKRKEQKQPT